MTTGPRARPASGGRRGGASSFPRRRRGRNTLKAEDIDYKDVQLMRRFVSERGKIVSGRRVGVNAKNQRRLARAIKRAQHLALVPLAPNHAYVTGAIQTDTPRRPEAPAEQPEARDEAPQARNGAPPPQDQNPPQTEGASADNGQATAEPAPPQQS